MYFTLKKKYSFHAAHRNQLLNDKCRNIHGHNYKLKVKLLLEQDPKTHITMLFSDIDELINTNLIELLDHSFILDHNDPLIPFLESYGRETGDTLKAYMLHVPTSAENLAAHIYHEIVKMGFKVESVALKETRTSEVIFKG